MLCKFFQNVKQHARRRRRTAGSLVGRRRDVGQWCVRPQTAEILLKLPPQFRDLPGQPFDGSASGELCGAVPVAGATADQMPHPVDVYFDSVSRVEMPRWSTGRVALLGDAARGATLSGTGTGTAIVGAYALAGELASARGHHSEAFRRYEQLIRPYAIRDKNGGGTVARVFAPGSRTTLWLRNRILGTSVGSGLILRAAAKQADSLVLPGYSRPLLPGSHRRTDLTWGER